MFVHGLHTDDGAWISENGIFWPDKLLPAKAPNSRILSSKYPIESVFFNGEERLSRASSRLIDELMDLRNDEQSVSTFSPF